MQDVLRIEIEFSARKRKTEGEVDSVKNDHSRAIQEISP